MKKYRLLWTGPALDDLRSIRDYISADGRPRAAQSMAKRIRRRLLSLQSHPESGRRVPEFAAAELREVIVSPYRIIYELKEDRIIVLRIWHGRRDLTGWQS